MRIFLVVASLLLAGVLAQDTYNCPDGWTKHEHHGHCNCFLMSGSEAVTQPDAEVLCAFHDGAWLAELDHPGLNYWMKSELLKVTEVGEYGQFWLGAYTEDRHDEHQPGNWTWTHKNAPVEWFDWAEGQPNNIHGQNCLVMQEVHDFLFPMFRDYFWNDFACDLYAHYICQNTCA